MLVGIKKKSKFEETKHMDIQQIAKDVSLEDQMTIEDLLKKIRKDARGNFNYSKNDALALLPFFNKYIDDKVGKNIFGCGGCVNKIIKKMFQLQAQWRNQTK